MLIEKRQLTDLGARETDAARYLPDLNRSMEQNQIDTKLRIAHFLAQVLHESARMRLVEENLNYSEQALLRVFHKYFTPAQARAYARNPKKIASRVYGGRMGNGAEASGDGFRYRGRGLIQLTGKSNYRKFSQWIGDDVVTNPDLVAERYAVHSAVYYWMSRDLNALADQDDIKRITRAINGGLNGLADRNAILDRAKQVLGAEVVAETSIGATHRVTASSLNLRNRPRVSPATKICALPQGTPVALLESVQPDWARVRVVLNGRIVEGFVAVRYLQPLSEPTAPEAQPGPPTIIEREQPTHRVKASSLNFRREPAIASSNRIGSLPLGTRVEKIADAPGGWVKIRALVDGQGKEGYVSGKYLELLPAVPEEGPVTPHDAAVAWPIPPVHLQENRTDITRTRDGDRAYPLGEADRPGRTAGDTEQRVADVLRIIRYLDSEDQRHRRYQPQGRATFCNIYAYDFCYLAGVYLPRVWWTDRSLLNMQDDIHVPVEYAKTVREMNANMLLDWFEDHGAGFGWKRVFDLDVLQAAANNGEACIIVAQRKHSNQSGHITVVAPEHDGFAAARNGAGEVLRPLESQAGSKNHRFFSKPTRWWLAAHYRNHGFWRHA